MADNDEILRQIAQLEQAISKEKRKRQPLFHPSRHLTLVNASTDATAAETSQFVRRGNTLVRAGTASSQSLARPPPKRQPPPSTNRSIVVVDGKTYKTTRNTLVSSELVAAKRKLKEARTIEIDGVPFVVKGRKLVRKDAPAPSSNQKPFKTPKRLELNGISYLRTKSGNLVRSSALSKSKKWKKRKPSQYCQFYGRFGECKNKDTCKYIHDPYRITACTKFLLDRCPPVTTACPFSHTPTAFNTPLCIHTLQQGKCTKPNCKFVHVEKLGSQICKDFLKYGYCDDGAACPNVHSFTCPEFFENKFCANPKCRYKHDLEPRVPNAHVMELSDDDDEEEDESMDELDVGLDDESSASSVESEVDEEGEDDVLKIYLDDEEVADNFE